MDHRSEKGALLIEAALSLMIFIFAMLTIFTMFHVSLAQARVGTALNLVAKEISQYSYIYDLTGLNAKQAELASKGGSAQSILSDNLSEVSDFYGAIEGVAGTIGAIGENSDSFLAYALNQGVDALKGVAVGELSRAMMRKHFGSNPDDYLKGLGIEDGMRGLSFMKTRLFTDGEEDNITLNVRYQITVIKLLNIDIKFNIEQCAQTKAWTS